MTAQATRAAGRTAGGTGRAGDESPTIDALVQLTAALRFREPYYCGRLRRRATIKKISAAAKIAHTSRMVELSMVSPSNLIGPKGRANQALPIYRRIPPWALGR